VTNSINPIAKRDTILVVDDTPDTLGFLTRALEHAGMTVLVATGGDAALRLLSRITPDLILLDAVMPGLDGFDTCSRLKADPALQDIPVIFMTGLSDTQDVVRGLEAGGVDYVAKPIVLDELLARIRVHLGNARTATRTRAALDATGRFLAAVDASGTLIWCTPQAAALIADAQAVTAFALPKPLVTRLQSDPASLTTETPITYGRKIISIAYLSRTGPNEFLFRLREQNPGQDEAFLRDFLSLTTREAEVLIWIARGKSNRDIADILGISPRTVNKHLEQIFVKLGVENRASAAALAVGALARRS
jgi:DNA-binding NarL/FixJ family response regulator